MLSMGMSFDGGFLTGLLIVIVHVSTFNGQGFVQKLPFEVKEQRSRSPAPLPTALPISPI